MEKDTQKDTLLLNLVALRQRCTMLSSDSMLMARCMVWSPTEDYVQGRPLSETENNAVVEELMQEHSGYFMLKRYRNKFQHSFETSQQRSWTEIPQAGTIKPHLTPGMEKKILDFARHHHYWIFVEYKCCLETNAPCSSLYLATCTLGCHWESVLTRNML